MRFNPGMLIRRNTLGCHLTSDPVGFLCQDYMHTIAQGSQGSSHTTQSAAGNDEICFQLFRRLRLIILYHGNRR